jgi:hypothetical protein
VLFFSDRSSIPKLLALMRVAMVLMRVAMALMRMAMSLMRMALLALMRMSLAAGSWIRRSPNSWRCRRWRWR